MNGVHDLGGMHGLGPISPEPEVEEPVFHEEWEKRVFGLTLAAGFLGQWNIDMSRHSRERQHPIDYLRHTYYENWLAGLKKLLVEAQLVSPKELQTGRAAGLPLLRAQGEKLPFGRTSMEAIIAECSLSLMDYPDKALAEFLRILRPAGRLILTDMYVRNGTGTTDLRHLPLACCIRGARSRSEIVAGLAAHHFRLLLWEDHSAALTHLAGQLVWTYGSLAQFWRRTGTDPDLIQETMSQARPGYYALIAEKRSR